MEFATKPQLAALMIEAALDAGARVSFVAGDEVYGLDPILRTQLRARRVGYVLAIARNQHIQATETARMRADDVVAGLTDAAWELRTCGTGSKGERFYAWAFVHDHTTVDAGVHSLLVRRNVDTGELAFYRCWTPHPVPLATLVTVAGRRWMIEESFQAAKTQVGLDHYQCRTWTAWHRFALLAMIALAILVITAAHDRSDRIDPRHDAYVPLSVGELRRLITAAQQTHSDSYTAEIRWSWWRRHHQAAAITNAATWPPTHNSQSAVAVMGQLIIVTLASVRLAGRERLPKAPFGARPQHSVNCVWSLLHVQDP